MQKVILGILYVAFVVYTLVDVIQSDDEERHGLPKGLWVAAIILLPLIGSIAWVVLVHLARRKKGRASAARWERAAQDKPAPAPADEPPMGPDDDPEYIWLLEQARRKREREERERERREGTQQDDNDDKDA